MVATSVWCLVINHKNVPIGGLVRVLFESDTNYIADLQNKVKEAMSNTLKDVDAYQLLVWRCKDQPTVRKFEVLKDWVSRIFRNAEVESLEGSEMIADLGPEILLVQVPDLAHAPRLSPPLAGHHGPIAPRDLTVDALYKRLEKYKFVMVRGTPASGKSILAHLLIERIRTQKSRPEPIVITNWPTREENQSWFTYLTTYGYVKDKPSIIVIDDAQLTYWDSDFWNIFLKPMTHTSIHRIILFASYGSPSGVPSLRGTPTFDMAECKQIGLRPIDHRDGIPPVGLFLTEDEYMDLVHNVHRGRFTRDFLDYVYNATAGHAGAVNDFLQVVLTHDSYRNLRATNKEYSLEIFRSKLPIQEFWSGLENIGIFRRGLPPLSVLQKPDVARIFRTVLSNNNITMEMDGVDKTVLETCFKHGWLHAVRSQGSDPLYVFATPLHQWFVERYLGSLPPLPAVITDRTLSVFAINVIQGFSHQQLSSPRLGASGAQRPPEAQFQDEFYRCCFKYTKGSLVAFSEFGSASGRIDFCIPSRGWGVELLRDGNGLENYLSHLTGSGIYTPLKLSDCIILDFRKTQPQKKHPKIPNLYHVVFSDDYKTVQVLVGPSLDQIEEFVLLN